MTTTRTRRITRHLAVIGVAGVAVLSLSGCLSMTANLEVASDATADGTFAIGVQKQAATMLGLTDLAAFEAGIKDPSMTEGSGDLLNTGDCVASETDAEFLYTCTFTDAAFTSGEENPWTITASDDVITFTLVNEASSGEGSELLSGGSLGQLTVDVTFPGEITSIVGEQVTKNSDTSATISAPMTDAVNVTITSKTSGGGGAISTVLIIVGIALLAIILIALVLFLVMRGRGKDTTVPAAAAAPVVDATVVEEAVVAESTDGTIVVEDTIVAEAPDGTAVVEDTIVAEAPDGTAVVEDTIVAEAAPAPAADEEPPPAQG